MNNNKEGKEQKKERTKNKRKKNICQNMTTPYAVSTSIGSVTYDGYVNAPILGPLSTDQYPCAMPYHSYGTLVGIRPTPPQFYPSQEPVYAEMNTNARLQYLRTAKSKLAQKIERDRVLLQRPTSSYQIYSSDRQVNVTNYMNYIAPIPSSMYVNIRKSNAVGQSGYKVGLPEAAPITTKNYMPSSTRSSLRRARSGGCVAPKKKGAIENCCLSNGQVCAWGSIVRSTY
jgi:hypothetical protein